MMKLLLCELTWFVLVCRCMAVKSTPVQHEEVDFADMCAQLQHQLSTAEGHMSAKLNEQSEKYENTIRQLREQVRGVVVKSYCSLYCG